MKMNIRDHNREAWNREVEKGNKWTIPVSTEVIEKARHGDWGIVLTPTKPVPREWFPPLRGLDVLCLASGGGQQAPILSAAGANVTVLDNSQRQLENDRLVARRESLDIRIIEGDMADLSMLLSESFSLVVHPVSNTFVPAIIPMWKEAYRVLKEGGILLSGFMNPAVYLFDYTIADQSRILQVKYKIPYSDIDYPEEMEQRLRDNSPIEFSHTLEEQIGGQIEAGFIITGFYEDTYPLDENELIAEFLPACIATRAEKR
jgi:SAM-dependent methyltransferase